MDRRFLRPGWIAGHVLVFLAFLTCLRLGWWQWDRTHDPDGTAQNLGYALLWPAFGAAFIYMWLRFLHLEVLKDEQDAEDDERELDAILGNAETGDDQAPGPDAADDQPNQVSPPAPGDTAEPSSAEDDNEPAADTRPPRRRSDLQRPSQGVTISVATVGEDDDDDPELAAYNQALAALAEEDRRRAR